VIYYNLFLSINQLFFNILYMVHCKIKGQLKSSLFLSISLQMWLIKAFDGAHDQGDPSPVMRAIAVGSEAFLEPSAIFDHHPIMIEL